MPESHKHGYNWILPPIDHCTLWPIVIPLVKAAVADIAQAVFDHIVTPFGLPKEFLTDQGSYLNGPYQVPGVGRGKKAHFGLSPQH